MLVSLLSLIFLFFSSIILPAGLCPGWYFPFVLQASWTRKMGKDRWIRKNITDELTNIHLSTVSFQPNIIIAGSLLIWGLASLDTLKEVRDRYTMMKVLYMFCSLLNWAIQGFAYGAESNVCLLYTSPSPRDRG